MRRLLLLLAMTLATPAPAAAFEAFCNHMDVCANVPTVGGVPDYNTADPTRPWVIGGTTELRLAPGRYAPPAVYVIEDGRLVVEDAVGEVVLASSIFVCDNAAFTVRNSTFRSAAANPFQYAVWADGNAVVTYENATMRLVDTPYESGGAPGALLQVMQGHSTLSVGPSPSTGGFGLALPQFPAEALELAIIENATGAVDAFHGFGEFYISRQAVFTVANSFFFDVFFEICAGTTYTLPPLPALCDITNTTTGCITSGQPAIDFAAGPAGTPFTLGLTQDRVFSWALSTYPGSTVTVGDVPQDANLAIGLGGLSGTTSLLLKPGNPSTADGLTDRSITLPNTVVSYWHVWPLASSDVTLQPGSDVGDLLSYGVARAAFTHFAGGSVGSLNNAQFHLDDCVVDETLSVLSGRLWLVRTRLNGRFIVDGTAYAMDSMLPTGGQLDKRAGARLHVGYVTSPVDGTVIDRPTAVVGSVQADGPAATLSPFPEAVVEVDNGSSTMTIATLTAPVDGTLANLDPAVLPSGTLLVKLHFTGVDGAQAVAVRRVIVPPRAASSSSTGVSSSTAGVWRRPPGNPRRQQRTGLHPRRSFRPLPAVLPRRRCHRPARPPPSPVRHRSNRHRAAFLRAAIAS